MRFNLYRVEILRTDRTSVGYIIAASERHASEIVIEHELALNQEHLSFTLERVDETLPTEERSGLDALLESAPAGLASYCASIGWIAHTVPAPRLSFYRIEESTGEEYFVVAPNEHVASLVYTESVGLSEDQTLLFRMRNGVEGITSKGLRGLPKLLEFGPVGFASYDDELGWIVG